MKKYMIVLTLVYAMGVIENIHGMDKKLVKREKKPKHRTAFQEKALEFGKGAAGRGHKKTADCVLRHVPGPTAYYVRAHLKEGSQKKRELLRRAANTPSVKPSEAKEKAAEEIIIEYMEELEDFVSQLREKQNDAQLLKNYYVSRDQMIKYLAEFFKAQEPDLPDQCALEAAENEFDMDELFKSVRLSDEKKVQKKLDAFERQEGDEESPKIWND